LQGLKITQARIIIVGDVMLDRYYDGSADRISPEAPIPVLNLKTIEDRAGGAANVALNLASLGVQVSLLGFVGEDVVAAELEKILIDKGVESHLMRVPGSSTVQKMRFVSANHQLLRCDIEGNFTQAPHDQLVECFNHLVASHDVCILSDYAKGTLENPQAFIKAAQLVNKPILVDPKGKDFSRYRGATLIKPNQKEFHNAFEETQDSNRREFLAQEFLSSYNVDALLLTQGSQGMMLYQRQPNTLHYSCDQFEVKDVSGAGDTVIAMTALSLALEQPLEQAVAFANKAAGLVVTKAKTSALTKWECRRLMLHLDRDVHHCVFSQEEIVGLGDALAEQEKKLVMTNGCFDLLHPGHVGYLREARANGDFLLVAVNTDESVQRLKGPTRPVQPAQDRCAVLEALDCVDAVVVFSEDTPLQLIELVKPRVLVKGVDYTKVEDVVGGKEVISWGGEVKLLGPPKQWSSSDLLKKAELIEEKI
jgi:D-beta-D-heptose 7-phosphate kinase / D-beta-D-heptose 1-phosphate adenosyltransferase